MEKKQIDNQVTAKKAGRGKWIALVILFLLGVLAAYFMINGSNHEASALESLDGISDMPEEMETQTTNNKITQEQAEQALPVAQELTVAERKDVMQSVVEAAKQDVANAKAQLQAAKKAGDAVKAAEAQERLDNMRSVLKQALEKHADLGLAYPKELFED